MKSKALGIILIVIVIILAIVFWSFRQSYIKAEKSRLISTDTSVECLHTGEGCPFEEISKLTGPTIATSVVLFLLFVIGIYLIFIDRSKEHLEENQKTLTDLLKKTNLKESNEEKFNLILSALDEDEQKIIKAVKEQDGISQATLRIRVDISKTKLSFILNDLEKKNLIKKVKKGKNNLVYLKRNI